MADLLLNYLEGTEGAAKVLAHARLLVRLAGFYQEIVPAHLGEASCVANYKSRVLVIHASNGAVATKLRQLAPTLANELSKRGLECASVLVRVQARPEHAAIPAPTQKPLSARTSQELTALRDSLPASSGLRTAVEGLLASCAARQE